MKQSTQQLSAPRKQPSPRTPLPRTWFMGHGFTKIPDGILPRTFYIKVTDEHPEGIVVDEFGQKGNVRKINMSKRKQETYYELHFKCKGKN